MRYVETSDGEEVTELTKVATVYAVSDGAGNKVPVPYGFYYVGGTITSGVVISDKEGDKNQYAGMEDVGKYKKDGTPLEGNQFVWIPCSESEYKKRDWGYSDNSWDVSTQASEETQIQKYGGFYVGRYEAGTSQIALTSGKKIGEDQLSASKWQNSSYILENTTDSSKPTSKANEIPYFHSDFTTAEIISKRMYNTNYVNSGLITGTQWDLMLNFMSNETDKSIANAGDSNKYTDLKTNSDWGNYNDNTLTKCDGKYCTINTSNGSMASVWQDNTEKTNTHSGYYTLLTTGSTEEVKKKNLYDVAGNLWEWTQEAAGTAGTHYMLRGGSCVDAYVSYPACYRVSDTVSNTSTNNGFRVALYIK